ncbi:endonuclease SmrB [Shewanella yunxiaonensis]|uniref:Ribosome rescue factor SmrB n=1 Tax=Shewanella yunxiaonensis TaxID=2829809 RepID=A0ABX7YWY8_9GAMM|nr:endonuclease SmrB [Shewanella yunxiaonensis]QUN07192.1 endonuclease SmrB [Shewanella yunxiaonensis]
MNIKYDKDGLTEFQQLVEGITPFSQDKRHFKPPVKSRKQLIEKEVHNQADSYFSDIYQPLLPITGPMRWRREDVNTMELKRLRRGDYIPELLLDLHGYRQTEAKLELAALIQACVQECQLCCSVMHGHGTGILKQQVPLWLAQHPQVKAFHQAPREWGGDAALLILVDIGDQPHRR